MLSFLLACWGGMRTLLTWLASAADFEYQWDGESKGESERGRSTRGAHEKNICANPKRRLGGLALVMRFLFMFFPCKHRKHRTKCQNWNSPNRCMLMHVCGTCPQLAKKQERLGLCVWHLLRQQRGGERGGQNIYFGVAGGRRILRRMPRCDVAGP